MAQVVSSKDSDRIYHDWVLADYPKNVKVFVAPSAGVSNEQRMFKQNGFQISIMPEHADIAVFTGGADVNPALYGELVVPGTRFSPDRDKEDISYWRRLPKDCMKIGICRGSQLMNVLNGGRLWQDADNHGLVKGHYLKDLLTGANRMVSSTHHQQMRPAENAEIVAVAHLSQRKFAENTMWTREKDGNNHESSYGTDYEVVWYKDTRTLCFQPHPEYAIPTDTEPYFFELIKRYF